MILAVLLALPLAVWVALRRSTAPRGALALVGLVLLASTWIGARAFYALLHPQIERPSLLWGPGGFAAPGGLLLGLPCVLLTLRACRLPVRKTLDQLVPSFALVTSIGKIGCLVNGCCFGRPTDLPFYVLYGSGTPAGRQWPLTPLFPTQLLESLLSALLFGITLSMRPSAAGLVFGTWLVGFGLVRLTGGLLRYQESSGQIPILGLSIASSSLVAGVCIVAGLGLVLLAKTKRDRHTIASVVRGAQPAG